LLNYNKQFYYAGINSFFFFFFSCFSFCLFLLLE
jgi:hypothetical protein